MNNCTHVGEILPEKSILASADLFLRTALLSSVVFLHCLVVSAANTDSVKLIEGFTLKQDCYLSGVFDVEIGESTVRCENPRTSTVFLFRAKAKTISVINTKLHTYWTGPPSAWKPPFSKASYFKRSQYGDLKVSKTEPITWLGFPCSKTTYKTSKVFSGAPVDADEKLTITSAEIIASKAFGDFKTMAVSIGLIYGVPVTDGFPLLISFKNRKHSEKSDLSTKLLQHARLKVSDFDVPAGFQKVAMIEEVYGQSAQNLKDVLEGL